MCVCKPRGLLPDSAENRRRRAPTVSCQLSRRRVERKHTNTHAQARAINTTQRAVRRATEPNTTHDRPRFCFLTLHYDDDDDRFLSSGILRNENIIITRAATQRVYHHIHTYIGAAAARWIEYLSEAAIIIIIIVVVAKARIDACVWCAKIVTENPGRAKYG